MTARAAPDWLALLCDGENLRGWAMREGRVLATTQMNCSDAVPLDTDLSVMLKTLNAGANTPLIACGTRFDAALRPVPCTPLPAALVATKIAAHAVHVLPGLRQSTPSDVMLTAPVVIAGFLALNPGWDGVICLPAAQTIWAQVSAGEVVSFQTYLSGTLADALSAHPIYAPALAGTDWDAPTFDRAVEDTLSRPEKLAARLFTLHADHLLEQADPAIGRARLTGSLIGAELAAARPYWLGMNIALIGSSSAAAPYMRALQTQGAPATVADAERMLLAGFTAAYRISQDGADVP